MVSGKVGHTIVSHTKVDHKVNGPVRRQGSVIPWFGIGLAALSALLVVLPMPGGLNVPWLGWIALVPLLVAFAVFPDAKPEWFTLPFGLLWSFGVHHWYVSIFGPWGVFLIIGVGMWYGLVIRLGIGVQRAVPGVWKLFALPVVWSGLEFVQAVAPVVRDWWFVLLPKTQWGFPAGLQLLSVTGFPGISFMLMLSNGAVAALVVAWLAPEMRKRTEGAGRSGPSVIPVPAAFVALVVVAAVLIWGANAIAEPPAETFAVVATSDLANGPDILQYSAVPREIEGPYADTPEMSQAIFDVNAELTRQIVARERDEVGAAAREPADVAFVVWPENEFADADDAFFIGQVGELARQLGAYFVVDTVWRAPTGMHDTALMIGPDGREVGRRAKVHLFSAEKQFGFSPGPVAGPVFATPYGQVGLGVCYDYHYLDVARSLARAGADILLMPTDDDMRSNAVFPYYHATDGIFRAVEHRVAFASAGVNGVSIVVDPYGRVTAMGDVNERMAIVGETFTVPGRTLYTRFGDWFGWLMSVLAAGLITSVRWGPLLVGRRQ